MLLSLLLTLLGSWSLMEMPPRPSLEQLCSDSAIVVSAHAVGQSADLEPFSGASYRLVAFRLLEVVKGQTEFHAVETKTNRSSGTCFAVLVTTSLPAGCLRVPVYAPGQKYLLFLGCQCAPGVYGRTGLDAIWGEHDLTDDLLQRVRKAVEEQALVTLRRREAKLSTIPDDAEEHVVNLSEQDRINNYSRKAFYTRGDKRLGERGWWTSGQLAYESPLKNGMRDGLFRGWYPDGRLWQERMFRHGQLHGFVRQWDEHGNATVTYWLDGQNVTEAAYVQQTQLDSALPQVPPTGGADTVETQPER